MPKKTTRTPRRKFGTSDWTNSQHHLDLKKQQTIAAKVVKSDRKTNGLAGQQAVKRQTTIDEYQ